MSRSMGNKYVMISNQKGQNKLFAIFDKGNYSSNFYCFYIHSTIDDLNLFSG
jgi:hypothetical protein